MTLQTSDPPQPPKPVDPRFQAFPQPKAAQFLVRFLFYLNFTPPGWGNPIHHDLLFAAHNLGELMVQINKQALDYIALGGITVVRETDKPLKEDIETADRRCFFPMSSVAYMTTETRPVITQEYEEGEVIQ